MSRCTRLEKERRGKERKDKERRGRMRGQYISTLPSHQHGIQITVPPRSCRSLLLRSNDVSKIKERKE